VPAFASGSCRRRSAAYTLAASNRKPACACTDHLHQEVRDAIRVQHFLGIDGVMPFLEWKTDDGCDKCRPVLNYCLLSTWSGEARDDPRSRLVTERAHANIQKDGTYSVVPRMWGGLTNAAELRRIADVAEKYQVPTIKLTGGERIESF